MQPDGDYEVGYKKPPKHTQWKKGHCPNPKGRPRKNPKSLPWFVFEALNEKVTVMENGRKRSITKAEAAATQFANRAAQGDPKTFQNLVRFVELAHAGKLSRKPENRAEAPSAIVILPDNGRSHMPMPDELVREYARVKMEFDARQERQGAANQNSRKEVA